MPAPYQFYSTCVDWPRRETGALFDMIFDSIRITRRAFLNNVHRDQLRDLEDSLGYASHPAKGLTMANDSCVTYHRSKLKGRRVYFLRWSSIEYVFIKGGGA